MTRSDEERLADIRSAIERCGSYRDFLSTPELGPMAYDAVLRNLAVIGEAVRAVSDEFKAAHPEVTWPAIAGLRNIVVHEYFRVDPGLIRDILDNHLAVLASAVDGSSRSQ